MSQSSSVEDAEFGAAKGPLEQDTELRLGADARGEAANATLRALAKASRSYLIYDSRNQAIRGFLEALHQAFVHYQTQFGEMALKVRPFELVLDQQVVYQERDRERSLAFKLFRDGVRSLTLSAEADWMELTHLLEILSVRYVGIHQNPIEDDVVTLLWKAGFRNIRFEAVEGVMPDDSEEGGGLAPEHSLSFAMPGEQSSEQVPPDFDLPAPELEASLAPRWEAIDGPARATLLQEDTSSRLPLMALQAVHELFRAAADPTDPLRFEETEPFMREVRDFLLAEDQLESLLNLLRCFQSFKDSLPDCSDRVDALLAGALDARALGRLIHSIPRDLEHPPAAFFTLLALLPVPPVKILLDLLEQERAIHYRRILRELIEYYVPAHSNLVLKRLEASEGGVAADLLRVLARKDPDVAQKAIMSFVKRDDTAVELEFLRLARELAAGVHIRSVITQLLHASQEEVRLRSVELMVLQGEAGAFPVLRRHAEELPRDASREELVAVGQALVSLHMQRALELFRTWTSVAGFWQQLLYRRNWMHDKAGGVIASLQRMVPPRTSAGRLLIAIEGLALIPGEEAEQLLKPLTQHGLKDVRMAAQLARTRRLLNAKKAAAESASEQGPEPPAVAPPAAEASPAGIVPEAATAAPSSD